jgi:hypothetical protein
LTGRGLAGDFERKADHFAADGIPLTEFTDSAPTTPDPYQLALVSLFGADGHLLASNTVVAPVSTEMHCDRLRRAATTAILARKRSACAT